MQSIYYKLQTTSLSISSFNLLFNCLHTNPLNCKLFLCCHNKTSPITTMHKHMRVPLVHATISEKQYVNYDIMSRYKDGSVTNPSRHYITTIWWHLICCINPSQTPSNWVMHLSLKKEIQVDWDIFVTERQRQQCHRLRRIEKTYLSAHLHEEHIEVVPFNSSCFILSQVDLHNSGYKFGGWPMRCLPQTMLVYHEKRWSHRHASTQCPRIKKLF